MVYFHFLMIVAGLIMVAAGLSAIHFRSGTLQKIGALCAPIGLVIALLGVLLVCVPGFFSPE